MNKPISHILIAITTIAMPAIAIKATAASLSFAGTDRQPWSMKGAAATGLEEIYVIHNLSGATASFKASSQATDVTVSRWGTQGAAYATQIPETDITRSGNTVTLKRLENNTGYTFTEGNRTAYYWVVDYSAYRFTANSLDISDEQECGRAWLELNGNAAPISYHGINGRSWTLSRDLKLTYTTLTFDPEAFTYISTEKEMTLESIGQRINVEAPLCDTYFTLTGDRFLKFWNEETDVTSPRYQATTVDAEVKAVQISDKPDNQVNVDTDGLGGSAPLDIEFSAAVTDAAIFHEWQFSPDEDFRDITMRTPQLNFTQTFNEMGTSYVRFITANADATCESQSETFKIYIGESFLRCPNAFSPGASEGVNDQWKVSYKSLISFECYIFNSWGQKMAEFHNPALGWDGRFKGKPVPPGTYYYVIKATGSDNKKYNLSGDINIVGYSGDKTN